ncbi:MAG: AMP-binding protein, partial [Sphingomicrobium sp.]
CGGSAAPRSLIEAFDRLLGVELIHAWGMTETSPLATVNKPLAHQIEYDAEQSYDLRTSQGRTMYGVELMIVGEEGGELARDGKSAGDLKVRGPWIAERYFGDTAPAIDGDGWFATGDVARLTPHGFLEITDRSKDVIKSGGEWISSIDLENAAVGHPKVTEAAVIGVPHPRWQERPLLLVTCAEGEKPTREELLDHLSKHVARWWLPDDVLFVDELPHTATGKLLKVKLRETWRDHYQAKA